MALKSTFTPKASLTEAPTNLKEAIDWVLRVTGRDGKENKGECICGLAAAVTDLLQSVQLEYHGYQGDVKNGSDTGSKNKGASKQQVTDHLNGLFSLVQGLGGTSVVRTYIDQLAQVLSALVGWSTITKCDNKDKDKCNGNKGGGDVNGAPHGGSSCEYLKDKDPENKCQDCGCMKWVVIDKVDWAQLGRGCTKCKDSGSSDKKQTCECSDSGDDACEGADKCQCAKKGKCCKCCCNGSNCKCGEVKDRKCICIKEKEKGTNKGGHRIYKDTYQSAYGEMSFPYIYDDDYFPMKPVWTDLQERGNGKNPSHRRHQCARILLGSVCLIWSGLTYMHWTGKYYNKSPYWNNHILDGSGLDDGTLSQWLQALGFPKAMLNDKGPKNRLDQIIWDGFMGQLFLGFTHPGSHASDGTTAKQPYDMNYAGFVHTAHRDAFNEEARVFPNGTGSSTGAPDQNKIGAVFKLYILSCAYFTGLQKKSTPTTPRTPNNPKTIRDILYWLSALPYSQAYKDMLDYAKEKLKEVTKKPGESDKTPTLAFLQQGRTAPITVHEYNLFAHFQAVTQYCPLVLIGIQGGLKGTDSSTPAIHSLYANTECNFTYPSVQIQAYNQVVHYIRALFYQLYFLRKQCAVKVALGGKWRECRYGQGVESKGVISWMCLGCNPMEHDRKGRVQKVKKELVGVVQKVEKGEKSEDGEDEEKEEEEEYTGTLTSRLKSLLETIGDVVVQLGNAQEALEGKDKVAIQGVIEQLRKAKEGLDKVKDLDGLNEELEEDELEKAKEKLGELTNGRSGALDTLVNEVGKATSGQYDPGKNKISEAINKVREVLTALQKEVPGLNGNLNEHKKTFNDAIEKIKEICSTAKCSACGKHSDKCGRKPQSKTCDKCHQQYMDGTPSPLQAFLEDRLPGFSCDVVRSDAKDDPNYPPAASHLGHCNGSGQCCPLPMGFRGHFHGGSISDCTGARLYGILYFFSNENMMQSCVYTLVRVTAALSATTPQVLGDVFGFFRGGVGNKEEGKTRKDPNGSDVACKHEGDPSDTSEENKTKYFCGWCASGLRDVVKAIEWIPKGDGTDGGKYRESVGKALIGIKGDKGTGITPLSSAGATTSSNLSALTKDSEYLSPLTGELYTAVSATFGGTYLSWVLYLSDALHSGLESLAREFKQIECRGCKGQCDPNKCRKGHHGQGSGQCGCQSIVSCTGVLPVLYRHGFSYGNPFNLEGYQQSGKDSGDYSIEKEDTSIKHCHEFLESLSKVLEDKKDASQTHPLSNLLSQVGKLQYDIRLPWIFVLTVAWLIAVLYLAFGAIWPLDWTHMRSHWLRGGEHQWEAMWYKVMTGRKGMELVEYFGRR